MKTTPLCALVAIIIMSSCTQVAPPSNAPAASAAVLKDSIPFKPLIANFEDELPDTLSFSGNGLKIRLLEDTANYRYAIQRMENNQWLTLDSFDKPRDLSVDDWNKDGCPDILMGQKWHIDLALFNPTKSAFEKPFDIGEPDGLFVVDSAKHLYYSMLTNKFNDEHSRLFTIENYRQVLRGYIQGYVSEEEFKGRENPNGVFVYKFKNNQLPEEKLYEDENLQQVDKFTMKQYKALNTSQYQFYKQYWEKNTAKF